MQTLTNAITYVFQEKGYTSRITHALFVYSILFTGVAFFLAILLEEWGISYSDFLTLRFLTDPTVRLGLPLITGLMFLVSSLLIFLVVESWYFLEITTSIIDRRRSRGISEVRLRYAFKTAFKLFFHTILFRLISFFVIILGVKFFEAFFVNYKGEVLGLSIPAFLILYFSVSLILSEYLIVLPLRMAVVAYKYKIPHPSLFKSVKYMFTNMARYLSVFIYEIPFIAILIFGLLFLHWIHGLMYYISTDLFAFGVFTSSLLTGFLLVYYLFFVRPYIIGRVVLNKSNILNN